MTSRRLSSAYSVRDGHPRGVHGIELGHEPPIGESGEQADHDRAGPNLRWLCASVLIGLTGASLIGAAIYVSLQGETTFAEAPERAGPGRAVTAVEERAAGGSRRGDKLVRQSMVAGGAKQTFRTPTTQRVGDREVVKVRPFVRLATNLSLTTGAYATDIPPFNPNRLFTNDGGEPRAAEMAADAADAEVSFVRRDLAPLTIDPGARTLSDEDVLAQIEEERRMQAESGRRAAIPIPAQLMLSRTLRQPGPAPEALGYAKPVDIPFSSIEVRVIPENVTTLAKLEPRAADAPFGEVDVGLKAGENVEAVLRANGAGVDEARAIVALLGGRARGGPFEGLRLRLLVAPSPGGGRQVARVIVLGDAGPEGIAARNDRGQFVAVAVPADQIRARNTGRARAETEEDEDDEEGGVRLYESLHETVAKHDLPRQTVDDLVRIFGYDVDFQRRVQQGDHLELFYAVDEESGDRMDVLHAALTVAGETRRVYRFQSAEDGTVDYFDGDGRSLKKFLLRKPIGDAIMRSGFGYRRHPILGYAKMHTGVDWSNRIGTPILAAGNGVVIKAEWDSGYGRRVEIQHTNGYVTTYSHQSRFARGIAPGARVRQGQVIGYVGSTGLSTGPHLHYEVAINGSYVDPMRIRLPRGRELEGRQLADFKRQREQTDQLLAKAGDETRVAQR